MFSHSFFTAWVFSPSYFPPNGGYTPPSYGLEGDYPWDVYQDSQREPVFPVYQR